MKDLAYPLELFTWHNLDAEGNVIREVRDANRNTVFFMRIKGREYLESKRFTEELAPMVVKLLNECGMTKVNHPSPAIDVEPNAVVDNGNHSSEIVDIPVEVKRGRGRLRKA